MQTLINQTIQNSSNFTTTKNIDYLKTLKSQFLNDSLETTNSSNSKNSNDSLELESESDIQSYEIPNAEWINPKIFINNKDSRINLSTVYPLTSSENENASDELLDPEDLPVINKIRAEDRTSSTSSNISDNSKKISKAPLPNAYDNNKFSNIFNRRPNSIRGKKNPWLPHEDDEVIRLINLYGQSWSKIGNIIKNRTGKQVRDRYLNYLRPDLKDENFSEEEDQLLANLYLKFGNRWSKIANCIPGRSECQVKNRFHAFTKKNLITEVPSENINAPKNSYIPCGNFSNKIKCETEEKIYVKEELSTKDVTIKEEEGYIEAMKIKIQGFTNQESRFSTSFQNNMFLNLHEAPKENALSSLASNLEEDGDSQRLNELVSREDMRKNHGLFAPVQDYAKDLNSLKNYNKSAQTLGYRQKDEEENYELALEKMRHEFSHNEINQRYQELARRKRALEFFYKKTLEEMAQLEKIAFGSNLI